MFREQCLNFAMRKSCRLINQFYEKKLQEVNLNIGQFAILRAINFCKQTTNSSLKQILKLDQTTLTRNLKPLIRDSLVQISSDAKDRRVKIISLTQQGIQLYKQALPLWEKAQQALIGQIGTKEAEEILQLASVLEQKLSIDNI